MGGGMEELAMVPVKGEDKLLSLLQWRFLFSPNVLQHRKVIATAVLGWI